MGDYCACRLGEDCLFYGQEVEQTVECISCSNTLSQACIAVGESQAQWGECRTCWGVIRGKDTGARGLWSKVAATIPLPRERDRVENELRGSGGVWDMERGDRRRLLRQIRSDPVYGSGSCSKEKRSRSRRGNGDSGLRAKYSPQELGQGVHRIDWDDIENMTDETQEVGGNGQARQQQEQEAARRTARLEEEGQAMACQQQDQEPVRLALGSEEAGQELTRQQQAQESIKQALSWRRRTGAGQADCQAGGGGTGAGLAASGTGVC